MGTARLAAMTAAAVLSLAAAAMAAPATPDPAFGTDGTATPAFAGFTPAAAPVLVDAQGRAVVAGTAGGVALVRTTPAGAPDPGFGGDPVAWPAIVVALVAHQGGYVAGGWVDGPPLGRRFALARFTAAGDPDPGFGDGGVVLDDLGAGDDELHGLAVDAQGRIVAVGRSTTGLAVARYDADGTPDPTLRGRFDVAGVAGEEATATLVEPDGRVVLAGSGVAGAERRLLAFALTPTGVPDGGFGVAGSTVLDVGDATARARALLRQPDGRLLVAGTADVAGAGAGVVARLLADGTPDAGFSTDGVARVAQASGEVAALALEPGGKVVAAGSAGHGAEGLVARLRPAGGRDPGFGVDGIVRRALPAPGGFDGIAVTAAGRIVAGGRAGAGVHLLALVGGDSSDPELRMSAEGVGDLVTFTATVTNRGADPARDVRVTLVPAPGAAGLAASTPAGACAGLVCELGAIAPGALGRVKLLARTAVPLSAAASVSSATFDADLGNNRASASGGPVAGFLPDRTRPRVTLALPARSARALRRRFAVIVGADEAATVAVTARAGRGAAARVAARGHVRLSAAGSQRVTLRLTAAGRDAIARSTRRRAPRRLRLTLAARAVDRFDNVGRVTVKQTLRL